jgi:hypothetical protein
MPIKEIPQGAAGEQLTFKGIELGELVRALNDVETEKKQQNEEWGVQIKAYRKRILKLAMEMNAKD